MFAAITSGDWTAIATVGGFLLIIGGAVERFVYRRLSARRKQRSRARKTVSAVWGSVATGTPGTPEYDPEQPGLITIVADLAKQVEKQGRDADNRSREFDRRLLKLEEGAA